MTGRAVVLRIEPPAVSRPCGLPSSPRSARLTPAARIFRSGPARCACPKVGVCGGGEGGLAVPFIVPRRARRQGLRAGGACVLAAVMDS